MLAMIKKSSFGARQAQRGTKWKHPLLRKSTTGRGFQPQGSTIPLSSSNFCFSAYSFPDISVPLNCFKHQPEPGE